jgi:hypothetical protein
MKKIKKMAVGGKAEDCKKGQVWDGTRCISNISTILGPTLIGAGLAGMGTYLAKTRDKSNTKKAANQKIDNTLKKVTSNVMKKGGMVKKRVASKKK